MSVLLYGYTTRTFKEMLEEKTRRKLVKDAAIF